jgi:beta-xylosidase
VIIDTVGIPWLTFGSFWGGIKIVKLTNTGVRADSDAPIAIAARPSNGGALEAPFIISRCGYYYLFVSFDACRKGVDSTYNIRVGRSTSVTGPYVDKAGVAMLSGGGSPLVSGGSRWKGRGTTRYCWTAVRPTTFTTRTTPTITGARSFALANSFGTLQGGPYLGDLEIAQPWFLR